MSGGCCFKDFNRPTPSPGACVVFPVSNRSRSLRPLFLFAWCLRSLLVTKSFYFLRFSYMYFYVFAHVSAIYFYVFICFFNSFFVPDLVPSGRSRPGLYGFIYPRPGFSAARFLSLQGCPILAGISSSVSGSFSYISANSFFAASNNTHAHL